MFWRPDNVWLPGPWQLRCGEGEMGCFAKDRLYLKRNNNQPGWGCFTLDDLARFAGWWNSTDCGPDNTWCQDCDFYHDGAVEIDDLAEFTKYWLCGQ